MLDLAHDLCGHPAPWRPSAIAGHRGRLAPPASPLPRWTQDFPARDGAVGMLKCQHGIQGADRARPVAAVCCETSAAAVREVHLDHRRDLRGRTQVAHMALHLPDVRITWTSARPAAGHRTGALGRMTIRQGEVFPPADPDPLALSRPRKLTLPQPSRTAYRNSMTSGLSRRSIRACPLVCCRDLDAASRSIWRTAAGPPVPPPDELKHSVKGAFQTDFCCAHVRPRSRAAKIEPAPARRSCASEATGLSDFPTDSTATGSGGSGENSGRCLAQPPTTARSSTRSTTSPATTSRLLLRARRHGRLLVCASDLPPPDHRRRGTDVQPAALCGLRPSTRRRSG